MATRYVIDIYETVHHRIKVTAMNEERAVSAAMQVRSDDTTFDVFDSEVEVTVEPS